MGLKSFLNLTAMGWGIFLLWRKTCSLTNFFVLFILAFSYMSLSIIRSQIINNLNQSDEEREMALLAVLVNIIVSQLEPPILQRAYQNSHQSLHNYLTFQ